VSGAPTTLMRDLDCLADNQPFQIRVPLRRIAVRRSRHATTGTGHDRRRSHLRKRPRFLQRASSFGTVGWDPMIKSHLQAALFFNAHSDMFTFRAALRSLSIFLCRNTGMPSGNRIKPHVRGFESGERFIRLPPSIPAFSPSAAPLAEATRRLVS
jgi:hypothetical protein